ncbi:MAG TPA: hypothetical protein VLS90_05130 [Thermodesulfobacteriota bacterium]|nr:hypothetical protein [Thermodesulfobacteriota bacterium]
MKVVLPIVSVPVREEPPMFAATEKLTDPLPEPLAPEEIVIHGTLLAAVHGQPAPPLTFTVPLEAPPLKYCDVGEIATAHDEDAGSAIREAPCMPLVGLTVIWKVGEGRPPESRTSMNQVPAATWLFNGTLMWSLMRLPFPSQKPLVFLVYQAT